jgi:anti-anti-sigma regulatory factor
MSGKEISFHKSGSWSYFEGDLSEDTAPGFERLMIEINSEPGSRVMLDFSGLDIEDGVALAVAINSLRLICSRSSKLLIRGAPQMLGHNLYRTGMLVDCGQIEMVEMRLDEPAGF